MYDKKRKKNFRVYFFHVQNLHLYLFKLHNGLQNVNGEYLLYHQYC